MIIILHVTVALLSIFLTTLAFMLPSAMKLRAAKITAGLTLASGVYLVWSAPAYMVQACVIGIAYLAVVSVGIVLARGRLARIKTITAKN
jgi:hypothetical protein